MEIKVIDDQAKRAQNSVQRNLNASSSLPKNLVILIIILPLKRGENMALGLLKDMLILYISTSEFRR